jgi:hypothetical protein
MGLAHLSSLMVGVMNGWEGTESRTAAALIILRGLLKKEPISISPAAGDLPDSCGVAFIRVAPNLLPTSIP